MNQQGYKKLISGQKKGVEASIARFFLRFFSIVYLLIILIRNFLYSAGWLKIHAVKVPVISIGNITTGGTGKTPLVVWLYNQIIENLKFQNCAILTRGYKTTQTLENQNYSDEPKILAQSCPKAKIIINPDRVTAAQEAINNSNINIIILDDAFQHRRLKRNLDIVTIDATCPFGYGKILPAGLLREPVSSLKRADAVVITRCDLIDKTKLQNLTAQINQINPKIIISQSVHSPIFFKAITEEKIGIENVKGKKVFAFCGIGNPEAFFESIKKAGMQLAGSKIYNDHHVYTKNDINDIYEEAEYLDSKLILATQKDWTKISLKDLHPEIPFAYAAAEIKFIDGEDKLKELIEKALTGKIPQ